MELNQIGDIIIGAVAMDNIVEGRFVVLASHSLSKDYGSQSDLPGARLPVNSTEASRAKYITKFEQDNRSLPIYQPNPAYSFALRYGFDQAENAPFSADVYITHPGVQVGRTIPSGSNLALHGEGIYTIPSGAWISSANLKVPGATFTIANRADDTTNAGKVKTSASNVIGEVVRYNASNDDLTIRVYG